MKRKRVRNNGGTVRSILQRDRKCWLCKRGVSVTEASRDHLQPRASGGYNKAKNYRLAHKACNSARGALPEREVAKTLAALEECAPTSIVQQALLQANREWMTRCVRRTYDGRQG